MFLLLRANHTQSIFLVDYGVRLWVAPDTRRVRRHYAHGGGKALPAGAWRASRARLAWLVSWESIIYAVSTFPFFIDIVWNGKRQMPSLAWVRALRIFLLFRTSEYATAVNTVTRVLFVNRNTRATIHSHMQKPSTHHLLLN